MIRKPTVRVLLLFVLALPAALAGCGDTASTGTPTTVAVPPAPPQGTTEAATPAEGGTGSPTTGTAATPGQWAAGSPEQGTYDLYNWYTHIQGNPLSTGAYKNNQYLTKAFIERIDTMMMSARPGAVVDPIVCAQNPPTRFSVGRATITDEHAVVPVKMLYASGSSTEKLQVVMVQENGQWKANSVTCPAP